MVKKKDGRFSVTTYRGIPIIPDKNTYGIGTSDKSSKYIYGDILWKQMNTQLPSCSICGEYKDNMKILKNKNNDDDEIIICKECYKESQYTSKW